MLDFLNSFMPNVMKKLPDLRESTIETIQMTFISWIFIFVFGMIFGVLLTVTKKGGLLQNTAVYQVLDKVINRGNWVSDIALRQLAPYPLRLVNADGAEHCGVERADRCPRNGGNISRKPEFLERFPNARLIRPAPAPAAENQSVFHSVTP